MDVPLGLVAGVVVLVLVSAALVFGVVQIPFLAPKSSPSPAFEGNLSNSSSLLFNASCFGKPNYWGYAANRSSQDCTGDGEFLTPDKADVMCNTYPPAGYLDYAKNLSLYCNLEEPFKGVCCV